MDLNLIQNIVYAILISYFLVLVFKSLVSVSKLLTGKIIIFLHRKKLIKNVDQEFIDYLKGDSDVK